LLAGVFRRQWQIGQDRARQVIRRDWRLKPWLATLQDRLVWKSPRARGNVSIATMLIAPADCPNTVTFAGSPPNAAISSRTHSSKAT
jgi:hypothetical protein